MDLCSCPILRFAAESERLTQAGVISSEDVYSIRTRIGAIIIGTLRVERGCTGVNKSGICPFYYSDHRIDLTVDPDVPLLKRRLPVNPETGQML